MENNEWDMKQDGELHESIRIMYLKKNCLKPVNEDFVIPIQDTSSVFLYVRTPLWDDGISSGWDSLSFPSCARPLPARLNAPYVGYTPATLAYLLPAPVSSPLSQISTSLIYIWLVIALQNYIICNSPEIYFHISPNYLDIALITIRNILSRIMGRTVFEKKI